MFGYAGSICHVDLTSGTVRKEELGSDLINRFIGGYGANVKLAYDLAKPDVDPLSPENVIIIGAGPFVGTTVPGSSRFFLVTKFPIPGYFAAAAGGMSFGTMLKRAGYDNVIITGKAVKPVYLKLDEEVKICDASNLWGKDIFAVTDELWARHNPCSVICVGVAGEKLVKVSFALVDKVSSLGKGGLGAVMGSKNLKAIVASGTRGIKVANPKRFANVVAPLVDKMRQDRQRKAWADLGQGAGLQSYLDRGMVYKNSTTLYPREKAERLLDQDYYLKHYKKAKICDPACPYPCHQYFEIKEKDVHVKMPATNHFQCIIFWQVRNELANFTEAAQVYEFANREGLDGYCTSDLIAFAVHLYQSGIITKKDTDGLELKPGFKTTMALMRQMAYREGFGDILADGIVEAAKKIGKEAEKYAVHIKGMGYLIDARNMFSPETFGQVVDPRGHQAPTETITMPIGIPAEQIKRFNTKIGASEANERIFAQGYYDVGIESKYARDWWALISCLPVCMIMPVVRFFHLETLTEIYSALTGNEMSPTEMIKVGERSSNLERLLNYKAGYTRKDDEFPKIWFEPLKVEGGEDIHLRDYHRTRQLTKEDAYRMLDNYYKERGWDVKTGVPTKQKLVSLGLEAEAKGLSLP